MSTDYVKQRTNDLVDKYTGDLDAWIRARIPTNIDNQEFAARSGALMIALNRSLASISVAFGETHLVPSHLVKVLVHQQFDNNHTQALAAVSEPRTNMMLVQ